MPISIPTSISGVSVPGAVTGPLAKLFQNSYQLANYSYPRNLGSDSTRQHVIKFSIKEPSKYYSPTATSGENLVQFGEDILQAVEAGVDLNVAKLANAAGTGTDAKVEAAKLNLKDKFEASLKSSSEAFKQLSTADVKRDVTKTIALYVPDTVQVEYSASYSEMSLTGALGRPYFIAQAAASLGNKFIDAAGSGFGLENMKSLASSMGDDPYLRSLIGAKKPGGDGSDVSKILVAGAGFAENPQMQVLFTGIGFRDFQFDFVLTPYSVEEAETIKNIIKVFKMAGAPKISGNGMFDQGLFMKVPDRFEIEFLHNGKTNENVHKIDTCVLRDIKIDYAPMGWATFGDGKPVQTKLTLQFQEIYVIDKNKIDKGY